MCLNIIIEYDEMEQSQNAEQIKDKVSLISQNQFHKNRHGLAVW